MKFEKVDEQKRIYVFAGNNRVVFEGVKEVCVRPSGTHRLNLANGNKGVVPTGWIAIEIEGITKWSF